MEMAPVASMVHQHYSSRRKCRVLLEVLEKEDPMVKIVPNRLGTIHMEEHNMMGTGADQKMMLKFIILEVLAEMEL